MITYKNSNYNFDNISHYINIAHVNIDSSSSGGGNSGIRFSSIFLITKCILRINLCTKVYSNQYF